MLLRAIALLSVIAALVISSVTVGFSGFGCLLVLPLSFIGVYLVLALIAFLYFYFLCKRVDLSVPQEEDDPFYRKVTAIYIEAIVSLLQVRMHTTGLEKTPKDGRFLLVCNHLDLMDPVLLLHYFKNSQLAFISKQENTDMFLIGKIMHKLLCQMINRDNDREALKTILKCISIVKEDKASIAVFPEGYTSRDGKLHHFRSGVFKIAQKANVPIVVCTFQNTQSIFRNAMHLKPTKVELHLVGVIPAEELKGVTAVDVAERVHKMMADDLGPELVAAE